MISYVVAALTLGSATDLTFVRHGETVANATGSYNSKTLNELSEQGQAQTRELTKSLLAMKPFQVIYASPSPRVLKTIAPYLKAAKTKAVLWPLLYECCTGKRPSGAHATSFTYGAKITVPQDLKPYFVIAKGWERFPNAPTYNAGLAQVQAAVEAFPGLCGGKRVLLVGHSGNGGKLLQALTGKAMRVKNATPMSFKIQAH